MKIFYRFALAASLIATPAQSWGKDPHPQQKPHTTLSPKKSPPKKQSAITPVKIEPPVFGPPDVNKDGGFCTFPQTNPKNPLGDIIVAVGNNVSVQSYYTDGRKKGVTKIDLPPGLSFISPKDDLYYALADRGGQWVVKPLDPNASKRTLAAMAKRFEQAKPSFAAAVKATIKLSEECNLKINSIEVRYDSPAHPPLYAPILLQKKNQTLAAH